MKHLFKTHRAYIERAIGVLLKSYGRETLPTEHRPNSYCQSIEHLLKIQSNIRPESIEHILETIEVLLKIYRREMA